MPKVIVITGAGIGLGRALARRFAAEGDSVVLLGRSLSKVERVAAEIGVSAMALGCDVASPNDVRRAFEAIAARYTKVDVLVNNAAVYEPFTVAEATDQQIQQLLSCNLAGPIYCARSAIPLLRRGGHIINVSSESVDINLPHLALYQATKAGLERFSKSLAQELELRGVRVSFVRAGAMFEPDREISMNLDAMGRFLEASAAVGLNLLERPVSHYDSVTPIFRSLVDLPADVTVEGVIVHARKAD